MKKVELFDEHNYDIKMFIKIDWFENFESLFCRLMELIMLEVHLKVRPLFSDLFKALLDFNEARSRSDRIDEQKSMGSCYREASHGGKLHVTWGIEDIDLHRFPFTSVQLKCILFFDSPWALQNLNHILGCVNPQQWADIYRNTFSLESA